MSFETRQITFLRCDHPVCDNYVSSHYGKEGCLEWADDWGWQTVELWGTTGHYCPDHHTQSERRLRAAETP